MGEDAPVRKCAGMMRTGLRRTAPPPARGRIRLLRERAGMSLEACVLPGRCYRRMIPSVRPELPTGTVTFVFTDVEGSTVAAERARRRGVRGRARRSPRGDPGGVYCETGASRWTRRETRSSSRSRRPRRSWRGIGLHGAPRSERTDPRARRRPYGHAARSARRVMSATMSTAPLASPPRVTAARCSSPRLPPRSSKPS